MRSNQEKDRRENNTHTACAYGSNDSLGRSGGRRFGKELLDLEPVVERYFQERGSRPSWGHDEVSDSLEGSFHSATAAKTLGSLMGYVTSAILGPCASGTATALRETLPWHIRYSGFEGALPEIRSVIAHIIGSSWRVRESGGINCLGRSTASEPSVVTFHRNTVTREITEAGVGGSIRTGIECLGAKGRSPVTQAPSLY